MTKAIKEGLKGAILAVVFIKHVLSALSFSGYSKCHVRLGFSVSLWNGDPGFGEVIQTKVCRGHDDTSNQGAPFQILSNYVVIVLV